MPSIASMFPSHKMCRQDVTQAYTQGPVLQRNVYFMTVRELHMKVNVYLELLKPLYRLVESESSWFHKYKDLFNDKLDVSTTYGKLPFHCKNDH